MESPSFNTAHTSPPVSFCRMLFGSILAVLVLNLSANGGAASVKAVSPVTARAHPVRHWYQVGLASWYGGRFQGRTTAAGETYDMNELTCAHPTLPMGTWLHVTNLHTKKATYVRVNDRGPVVDGRIVDLSYAAARVIGLSGVGRVKLEQVHPDDPALAQSLVAQLQMPVLFRPLGQISR